MVTTDRLHEFRAKGELDDLVRTSNNENWPRGSEIAKAFRVLLLRAQDSLSTFVESVSRTIRKEPLEVSLIPQVHPD
jgi:hypothetical protein